MLAREKDFAAARGSEVAIETRQAIDGRRRFRGTLVEFEGGTARVAVDGDLYDIPFAEVTKAKAIYEFTAADFAGDARAR